MRRGFSVDSCLILGGHGAVSGLEDAALLAPLLRSMVTAHVVVVHELEGVLAIVVVSVRTIVAGQRKLVKLQEGEVLAYVTATVSTAIRSHAPVPGGRTVVQPCEGVQVRQDALAPHRHSNAWLANWWGVGAGITVVPERHLLGMEVPSAAEVATPRLPRFGRSVRAALLRQAGHWILPHRRILASHCPSGVRDREEVRIVASKVEGPIAKRRLADRSYGGEERGLLLGVVPLAIYLPYLEGALVVADYIAAARVEVLSITMFG
mmetsp:Transcript_33847/g.91609  ORF Transcript_33847/g.91609 Transcript_33847/m.91609 type:complete len:264 (+) Transcript_33847:186-977(+)